MSKININLLLLLAIIFLDSFSYFIVIPILLELFYSNHYNFFSYAISNSTKDILISITLVLSKVTALLIAPLTGTLSDKYGRKKVIIGCLSFMAIGFLLPILGILKHSLAIIWCGRIINGIGTTSQPVAQATISDNTHGTTKARQLGLIAFAMTLAIVVGPLFGGYLSKNYLANYINITIPYIVAFLLTLALMVITLLYLRPNTSNNLENKVENIYNIFENHKLYSKKHSLNNLFLIFFCLELAWSGYYQSIFFYLKHVFNYSPWQISIFNSYIGLSMSIGLITIYPRLINFFKLNKILSVSLTLLFISFIITTILPYSIVLWSCATIISICTGIAYTCLIACISNDLPLSHQGKGMGYASTLLFLAWVTTGLVAGMLFSLNKLLPFSIATCILILALFKIKIHTHEQQLS